MNRQLQAWFRGGAEQRMAFLASAEERLKTTTGRIVEDPSMNVVAVMTAAADEVQAACMEGLKWMDENECPVPRVGDPLREAFSEFRDASETIIRMNTRQIPMSADSGEVARSAIARAQGHFYDATTAFGEEIGR